MNNGYILFYDSGVGGLTTLCEAQKLLKNERFLYFADDANCPYGNKSEEEIKKLAKSSLDNLLKCYNIKAVVLACNTLTTCASAYLREQLSIPIIGTEPAIVPATLSSKTKEVMVIATVVTTRQEKYHRLVKSVSSKVYTYSLSTLASDIEKAVIDYKSLNINMYADKIRSFLKKYKNIDKIVLGCTHYCFVKTTLKKLVKVDMVDGNEGVAKHLYEVLKEMKELTSATSREEVKIILSSGSDNKIKKYQKTLKYLNQINKM